MEKIIETNNLNKKFGGVSALSNVNFQVEKNEIRCVIGPNGAGKSTLFKALFGLIKLDSGLVNVKGKEISNFEPSARVQLGLGMTFQTIRAYNNLSVRENIEIASGFSIGNHSDEKTELLKELIELFDFSINSNFPAKNLAHHHLQWLEILMIIHTGADVLLLDEPTAGLAEKETGMTADAVKLFKKHGLTIIVVEHDLKFIKQIAEKITVMHQGGVFYEGDLQSTLNNVEVKNIYLGH